MFDYTVETNGTIDEAIIRLQENLKEEKFGILWQLDMKEKLKEKGQDLNQEFKILEVCNPTEAKRVLDQNKMSGYFLPCKIVVYADHGKTKIGMPKPTFLIKMVNDYQLNQVANNIEKRLISCINKSVK